MWSFRAPIDSNEHRENRFKTWAGWFLKDMDNGIGNYNNLHPLSENLSPLQPEDHHSHLISNLHSFMNSRRPPTPSLSMRRAYDHPRGYPTSDLFNLDSDDDEDHENYPLDEQDNTHIPSPSPNEDFDLEYEDETQTTDFLTRVNNYIGSTKKTGGGDQSSTTDILLRVSKYIGSAESTRRGNSYSTTDFLLRVNKYIGSAQSICRGYPSPTIDFHTRVSNFIRST